MFLYHCHALMPQFHVLIVSRGDLFLGFVVVFHAADLVNSVLFSSAQEVYLS